MKNGTVRIQAKEVPELVLGARGLMPILRAKREPTDGLPERDASGSPKCGRAPSRSASGDVWTE